MEEIQQVPAINSVVNIVPVKRPAVANSSPLSVYLLIKVFQRLDTTIRVVIKVRKCALERVSKQSYNLAFRKTVFDSFVCPDP